MSVHPDSLHTYPVDAGHTTRGLDCWCMPLFYVACDDCDAAGCWKCEDGFVEMTRAEADECRRPFRIVHADARR